MCSSRTDNRAVILLMTALGLGLGVAAPAGLTAAEDSRGPLATQAPVWPTVAGAAFALRNVRFDTPVLAFDTKGRELLAFNCAPRGRALYGRFDELVCAGGSFHAQDAGAWVGLQVAGSRAFTIEMTLVPAMTSVGGRGVIFAYGDETGEDVVLSQSDGRLSMRLADNTNPIDLFRLEAGRSVHVLITCGDEKWTAYRDGVAADSGLLKPAMPAWSSRQIIIGATWSGTDPWRGRVEGIAVFPRALTAGEAAAEAATIRTLQAGRKPAAPLRFRGTLIRQAKTANVADIGGYTRSLSAAEYKIDQVLSGEWKEPTITVLHWMILERKRLAIADRVPGTAVELSVERYEDHPHLESSRRDELDGDIAEDLFYCESENSP